MTQRPDRTAVRAAMERRRKGPMHAACPDHWEDCNDARLIYDYLHDPTPLSAEVLLAEEFERYSPDNYWWHYKRRNVNVECHPENKFVNVFIDCGGESGRCIPQPQTLGDLRQLVERMEREAGK